MKTAEQLARVVDAIQSLERSITSLEDQEAASGTTLALIYSKVETIDENVKKIFELLGPELDRRKEFEEHTERRLRELERSRTLS